MDWIYKENVDDMRESPITTLESMRSIWQGSQQSLMTHISKDVVANQYLRF